MKTIYVSCDGKTFESEQECKAYEDKITTQGVYFFDMGGDRVGDPIKGFFIYLSNRNSVDALKTEYKDFINEEEFSSSGLYVWNNTVNKYIRLPQKEVLRGVLKQIDQQGEI